MTTSHNSAVSHPRLVCRVVQGWVSVAGDGAAPSPPAPGGRHVAGCACCREFFQRAHELEAGLRRTAEGQRAAVPPGLERRIARAVRQQAPSAGRIFPRAVRGAFVALGATAGVALTVMVFQKTAAPEWGAVRPSRGAAAGRQTTHESADGGLLGRIQPGANALLGAEPLQHEVEAFYADARSALGFLALNFLPTVPGDAPPETAEPTSRRRPTNG